MVKLKSQVIEKLARQAQEEFGKKSQFPLYNDFA
jgi:hypothetical protein